MRHILILTFLILLFSYSTSTIAGIIPAPTTAPTTVPTTVPPCQKSTYFGDEDGDGYGNPSISTTACTQPVGFILNNTDCDDGDANEHPGQTWFKDTDNDNYSDGTTNTTSCTRPADYKVANELTAASGDCNDANPAINPGATEVCDGVDNDCDGQIDEGVNTTHYRDVDGDGYGNPSNSTATCTPPAGYALNNTDCDDNDAGVNPGATEIINNGKDDDCNPDTLDTPIATTTTTTTTTTTIPIEIPCPNSILPVSSFFDKDGGTGIVDVAAPVDCNWTAVSNAPSWITVISPGGSVTGDGKVEYSVSVNTSGSIRTGNINVSGDSIKTFMVTQDAVCSHSISPVSEFFDSSGGTGSLSVSAPNGCGWAAISDVSWLSINSGSSGSGDGTVNYTVSTNAVTNPRVGTITIEDETFTVSQQGTNPPGEISLSSASVSFGSSGGMGSVSVSIPGGSGGAGSVSASISDDSGWTATSDASWINITSSRIGAGNGTVNTFVTPNISTSPRTGTIKFTDSENCACEFTVTQEKLVPCTPTITPASVNFNAIGGSGSVSVSDPCKNGWKAVSNASWINVTSGSSESGDGTVKYTISTNDSFLSSRTGSITVAGQTFTVVQEVMDDLPDPIIRAKDSDGVMALKSDDTVSISVSLTEGGIEGINADWWLVASTPFETPNDWFYYDLNLGDLGGWTPGFSVTHQGPLFDLSPFEVLNKPDLPEGTYTFYFGVDSIMNSLLETGPENLRYDSFTVEINNTSCAASISIPSESFDFTGGTGSLSVSDPCNKGWMVTSNSLWIHITSGNTGIGNGTVQYIVNYNHTRLTSRASGIIISDQMFKVEQGRNTIIAE